MKARTNLLKENAELKIRLAEAEELLAAIRSGEVDAFVTEDQQVFTLRSADYAYRVLVETMNEGAATLALDGTMLYCNTRLAQMLELPLSKIIGCSMFDFIAPEAVSKFKSILKESADGNSRGEAVLKKSDGAYLPVLISCNPIQIDVAGVVVVFSDLSELKKTQAELEQTKRLTDIGTLAATIAHELRNPLAAIDMTAHNIKRKLNNPDIDEHVHRIHVKVAESDQIIANLLFYSRLKHPHFESINIFDIAHDCVEDLKIQMKKEVMLIEHLDPVKGILIEADPLQIKEVFANLLNNAYDSVTSEKGKISIIAENNDRSIKVTIEDNGCGIDKDILDKIFDPFFTTKAKGTGLGLSVCSQIINMHGGEIGIKSELGQGTSVVFRLPKKEERKKERKNK